MRLLPFLVAILLCGCTTIEHKSSSGTGENTLQQAPAAVLASGWVNYEGPGFTIALPGDWEVCDLKSGSKVSTASASGDANMRTLLKNQAQTATPDGATGFVVLNGAGEAGAIFSRDIGRVETREQALEEIKGSYHNDPLVEGEVVAKTLQVPTGEFGHAVIRFKDATGQPGQVREEFVAFSKDKRFGAIFFGTGAETIGRQVMDTFRLR